MSASSGSTSSRASPRTRTCGVGLLTTTSRTARRRDCGRRPDGSRRAGAGRPTGPRPRVWPTDGRGMVVAVSNRIRAALTTTVLTTAATGFMAGCGVGGDDEQVAYCTDENGKIVDDSYCDEGYRGPGAGLFFLYLGGFGRGLPIGTVLPSGGTRIH